MPNAVLNMCEKFHYDLLRNDRALGNGKSDNNKFVALGDPFLGYKNKKNVKIASKKRLQTFITAMIG